MQTKITYIFLLIALIYLQTTIETHEPDTDKVL